MPRPQFRAANPFQLELIVGRIDAELGNRVYSGMANPLRLGFQNGGLCRNASVERSHCRAFSDLDMVSTIRGMNVLDDLVRGAASGQAKRQKQKR